METGENYINTNHINRTCLEENFTQVKGKREGVIPDWINGSLVQNGPGKFTFGSDVFCHLFDGSALVRKFSISKGEVTYQCQFVKTESFKVSGKVIELHLYLLVL